MCLGRWLPGIRSRPRTRPRNIIARVIVFLLLISGGAVINVAVTWGCAVWGTKAAREPREDLSMTQAHALHVSLSGFGLAPSYDDSAVRFVVTGARSWSRCCTSEYLYRDFIIDRTARGRHGYSEAVQATIGWPMQSMTCEAWREFPGRPQSAQLRAKAPPPWTLHSSITLPAQYGSIKIPVSGWLPLRPVWPSFSINTIFYAAMLWLLWITPGKTRRFIRIKRHRCPACAYQIAPGTGPVCSECGHLLRKQTS